MIRFPLTLLPLLRYIHIRYFNICEAYKLLIFFLLILSGTAAFGQPDFETAVPSNFYSAKGTLSISNRHFRLGSQSLRWDWQAGDVLQITLTSAESSAINGGLFDWRRGHFELWVHNESASKDTFEIKFFNTLNVDQFRFRFNINYDGWRRLLRSYTYDMLQGNSTKNVGNTINIVAPASGSGTIYLDNLQYMRTYDFKQSDDVMPDLYDSAITKNYIISNFYYECYYAAPLVAVTQPTVVELAGLDSIRARIKRAKRGTAPTASELSNAITQYNAFNIVKDGDAIRGKLITDPSAIGNLLSVFSRSYVHNNNTDSRDKAVDLLKLMFDSGIAGGSGLWFAGKNTGYNQMQFFEALINVDEFADADLKYRLWHWIKWCTGTGLAWKSDSNGLFDTDDIHTLQNAFFAMVLFSGDNTTAVSDLKRLKVYFEKFLENQKGTSDGIKPDGTSFHHATHYSAYMYAMNSLLCNILCYMRKTPFQINEQAYDNLRKAAYAESLMSNKIYYANSLNGRHPFSLITYYNQPAMEQLAYIGGEVVNQEYDPVVAAMHSRMYSYATKIGGVSAESFPSGFWQMNYSPLSLYRRDNWVATIKGINNDFWATETYASENRYGRYQGYGALEILYPSIYGQVLAPSGMIITGWDWNKVPGTTSIIYPYDSLNLSATVSTLLERNMLNFAGGVKFGAPSQSSSSDIILQDLHGDYGMYGLNFQQSNLTITHSSTFTFRKSWFCFGKKIVCIGSNINNNRSWRNTITTLFQTTLASQSTPVTVDGSDETAFPFSQSFSNSGAHWIVDPYNTGYYIMQGSTIQVEKKLQTSPDESGSGATTTANYTNAYIDHGNAPANGKYAYVVIPNTTKNDMSTFAGVMSNASTSEFDILQQDEHAHIIRENADNVFGFSLFTSNTNLTSNEVLKANDVPCLVMLQIRNDTLRITVVNPDIHIVNNESTAIPVTIALYGGWLKASDIPAKYASLISTEDSETIVSFSVADGFPAEIALVKSASSVLPLLSLNLQGVADAPEGRNVLTMKFENNDVADYSLEYKPADAADWKIIDTRNIQGGDGEQSSIFYHVNPLPGENQYRVKCTDIDGTIKYSNIVQLKNLQAAQILIAPNPAKNDFTITLKQQPVKPLQWSLSDASGKIVKAGVIAGLRESVLVKALSAGVYYIKFSDGSYFPVVVMK
ncbi:MAG: chondroitinase family polysaccharide lyase [Agriterribacter sp.]